MGFHANIQRIISTQQPCCSHPGLREVSVVDGACLYIKPPKNNENCECADVNTHAQACVLHMNSLSFAVNGFRMFSGCPPLQCRWLSPGFWRMARDTISRLFIYALYISLHYISLISYHLLTSPCACVRSHHVTWIRRTAPQHSSCPLICMRTYEPRSKRGLRASSAGSVARLVMSVSTDQLHRNLLILTNDDGWFKDVRLPKYSKVQFFQTEQVGGEKCKRQMIFLAGPSHTSTFHPELPRLKHLANHVNVPDLSCQCESLLSSLQLCNAEQRDTRGRKGPVPVCSNPSVHMSLCAPNHLTACQHQVPWFWDGWTDAWELHLAVLNWILPSGVHSCH